MPLIQGAEALLFIPHVGHAAQSLRSLYCAWTHATTPIPVRYFKICISSINVRAPYDFFCFSNTHHSLSNIIMYMSIDFLLLISAVSAIPYPNHDDASKHKRTLTPDNTCGGSNGYTCNPNDSYGGACCSAAGYCGNTDAYCGSGCQSTFGTCGSPTSPQPQASSLPQVSPLPPPTGPAGSSSPATKEGCLWTIDGSGSFTHILTVDFSNLTALPTDTLDVSTDHIPSIPYTQTYTIENVAVEDGTLQLKVPGGQTASPILGAEISTAEKNILYGSVRTMMQISSVSGTVSGAFFYKSDSQEADIEVITGGAYEGVHYTNQEASPTADQTTVALASPVDLTSEMHEYRLDWLPDRTDFYLDGVKQADLTGNVPSTAGAWLWNNWRQGNPPRLTLRVCFALRCLFDVVEPCANAIDLAATAILSGPPDHRAWTIFSRYRRSKCITIRRRVRALAESIYLEPPWV